MINFTSLENRSAGKFGSTLNPSEKSAPFNKTVYIKKGFAMYLSQDLLICNQIILFVHVVKVNICGDCDECFALICQVGHSKLPTCRPPPPLSSKVVMLKLKMRNMLKLMNKYIFNYTFFLRYGRFCTQNS